MRSIVLWDWMPEAFRTSSTHLFFSAQIAVSAAKSITTVPDEFVVPGGITPPRQFIAARKCQLMGGRFSPGLLN